MAKVIETQEQLEELLLGIEMVGTRFEDWSFDWVVTEVPASESFVVHATGTTAGLRPEFGDAVAVQAAGWFIQSSFDRPDVDKGGNTQVWRGYGRKWYVERGSSIERLVFTCWLAIKQIVEHELHEAFVVKVGGRRVRLLDPHKVLEDVAYGSREIWDEQQDHQEVYVGEGEV